MTYATVSYEMEITGKKARKWFYAQSENFIHALPAFTQLLIQLAQKDTDQGRTATKNAARDHLENLMRFAEEISRLTEIPEVRDEAEKTGFLAWLRWLDEEMNSVPGKLATIKEEEFQKRLREVDVTEAF